MAFIELRKIDKSFGSNHVLRDVSLDIGEGKLITLLGPSGCGKSTLLRVLAGLESVNSGTIVMDGKDITDLEAKDRNMSMVFQHYSLFPNMTAAENVAFGLRLKKNGSAGDP